MNLHNDDTYWMMIWRQFYRRPLGRWALCVVLVFCFVGVYAPFLASSKPFVIQYDGELFFPLFRYLFYRGFYTKFLDIFFNLFIFTVPLAMFSIVVFKKHTKILITCLASVALLHGGLFVYFIYGPSRNPAFDAVLIKQRQEAIGARKEIAHSTHRWDFDLRYMNGYARLNLVLQYQQRLNQQKRLEKYGKFYSEPDHKGRLFSGMPTLWQIEMDNENREIQRLQLQIKDMQDSPNMLHNVKESLQYVLDRRKWILSQIPLLHYEVMPLVRPFHWEDDAGGDQSFNQHVPFWELTRINRKDLVAALIFGVRVSLVVGILAVALALSIGLPIGSVSGYYGGTFDIIVSRLLEILEGMPTFFMLLMVVAITQSKSIFLVIAVIGLFGWTTFARYIRGEFFKQRNLPYIEACRAQGFNDSKIIFSHIFPNAIPPVLTLLPFAVMGAITSEASLSFLGLGEEGSCSWGVLMDEGRTAFPGESYLLWPPAILLTILLVAIAMVGDAFRDALDPKLRR
ncbi:MAG: ABC transporter permease [Parachlamydiaceae bacterium]